MDYYRELTAYEKRVMSSPPNEYQLYNIKKQSIIPMVHNKLPRCVDFDYYSRSGEKLDDDYYMDIQILFHVNGISHIPNDLETYTAKYVEHPQNFAEGILYLHKDWTSFGLKLKDVKHLDMNIPEYKKFIELLSEFVKSCSLMDNRLYFVIDRKGNDTRCIMKLS